jgi:hypothetical protein
MYEYILFDEAACERFQKVLASRGLTGKVRPDEIDGFVVGLPDDLDDDILAAIEIEYDKLMEAQQDAIDATDEEGEGILMGVEATLPDGQSCHVLLPAGYGRRLVEHFSPEEIHDLVSIIAKGVLNPVKGPICRSL